MAAQHGGYRKPDKPAMVSGPGRYSQRTDGGPGETPEQAARYLSGGQYGEGLEMMSLQTSAPMSAAPQQEVIPLSSPTRYPNQPVTAGVDAGPGPGREAVPRVGTLRDEEPDAVAAVIRAAYSQFPSPHLRRLVEQLEDEGR